MIGLGLNSPAFVGSLGGGAVSYRYHRLAISGNNGDPYGSFSELILRDVPGGVQRATGGTATASSEYSATYAASKAFDGHVDTHWATVYGYANPSWLQYDLGVGNDLAVAEYAIIAWTADRAPGWWELQGSNDGVTWELLDSRSGITWADAETKTFTL